MKWLMRTFIACLVFCIFLFSSIAAHAIEVRPYSGHVNDFAGVLSAETIKNIETRLAAESQRADGVELAVVTLQSLEGEVIESVALGYFDQWQIGKRNLDNGVLLLLAVEDRQVRIQTGYGLEGDLPDGLAGRIIRRDILPSLSNDDYDEAVQRGVESILSSVLSLEPTVAASGSSESSSSIWSVLLILFLFFGGVALFIFLVSKFASRTGDGRPPSNKKSTPFKPPSRSSSRSSSKSFSFGGGRTGGGGASGKW